MFVEAFLRPPDLPNHLNQGRYRESGRTVTLQVKYADFQQITRNLTATSPRERGGESKTICSILCLLAQKEYGSWV